ncbi:MAG: YabP/YqfC family sporulation protein [Ruthenibacterium sp.]
MNQQPAAVPQKAAHDITVKNRKSLVATGVLRIISYDAFAATLETPLGTLCIGGQNISVSELSVQTGEVKINGDIEYVQYSAPKVEKGSFFQRLVR